LFGLCCLLYILFFSLCSVWTWTSSSFARMSQRLRIWPFMCGMR
jgi:hypothetical protein